MPLGAYLLLVGIFTSATRVARDAKLRKEFYKSATSQFNLRANLTVNNSGSGIPTKDGREN